MRLEELWSSLNRNWGGKLRAFSRHLAGHYGRITIILFGSRARGDYSASSDTDILVIVERFCLEDLKFMLDLAYSYGIVSPELHVFPLSYVIRNFEGNTLLMDAIYEGVILVDNLNITKMLKRRLEKILDRLKRTKEGWVLKRQNPL